MASSEEEQLKPSGRDLSQQAVYRASARATTAHSYIRGETGKTVLIVEDAPGPAAALFSSPWTYNPLTTYYQEIAGTLFLEGDRDVNREEALMVVQSVIQENGLPRALLARGAGLGEDAIFAWLKGTRAPRPDSVHQLDTGLRKRAEALREIAAQLEQSAEDAP